MLPDAGKLCTQCGPWQHDGAAKGDCAPRQPAGAVTASGGLVVSAGGITVSSGGGSTSLQVLSAAGAATFGSTVSITGALQAAGNVNLGSSSGNTLSVASTTALQAPVTAGSTVAVSGLVTASGGLIVTGQPDLEFPPMTGKGYCVVKQGVQGQCERPRYRSSTSLILVATA